MEGIENTKGLGSEEELEDEEDQNDNSGTVGDVIKDSDTEDSGKNDHKKKERNFTQSQVNRMMTREKNQGRAAAYRELGIDPKDTRAIKMFQSFVASQKTDEQKAAEKDAEVQQKQAEAEHRAMMAEAKAEAMMLGIKSQYVDDAVALALSKMSDDTELKTVLGELKEKYGLWFKDDDEESKGKKSGKTGQKGTGTSVKDVGKKSGKETSGIGARLAAQRKRAGGATSYWGGR